MLCRQKRPNYFWFLLCPQILKLCFEHLVGEVEDCSEEMASFKNVDDEEDEQEEFKPKRTCILALLLWTLN